MKRTADDRSKIKAIMLYLLKNYPNGLHRVSFYKLLFYAQQYELVTYGKTLIPDCFYAMPKGPVPSFVQGMIHAREDNTATEDVKEIVSSFAFNSKGDVIALEEPDMDYLAPIDVRTLDYVYSQYGTLTPQKLVALSHGQKCWRDAIRRSKTDPEKNFISRIDIAKSGQASDEMLDYIRSKELCNQYLV